MDHTFPTYRRSVNGRHFYRIESSTAFTEVQLVGGRALIHRVSEAAYPEQLRIQAMLDLEEAGYLPLDPGTFARMLDMHDGR